MPLPWKYAGFLTLALAAACGGAETDLQDAVLNPASRGSDLVTTGYAGCYVDSASARTLPTLLAGAHATAESCIAAAAAKGLAYAGLEYGGECGEAARSAPPARPRPIAAWLAGPTQPEICGGSLRVSVYATSAAPAPTAGYAGCYTDGVTRALPVALASSGRHGRELRGGRQGEEPRLCRAPVWRMLGRQRARLHAHERDGMQRRVPGQAIAALWWLVP